MRISHINVCFFCISIVKRIFLPIYRITDNIIGNVLVFCFVSNDMVMIIRLPQRIVFVEFRHWQIVRIDPIINLFDG